MNTILNYDVDCLVASPAVSFDAAERALWNMYSEKAEKFDERLAKNWKGDLDAILIFVRSFHLDSLSAAHLPTGRLVCSPPA